MLSLSKIATFALLAIAPLASAVAQPAPNAVEVATRAAPTSDVVKILTDAKAGVTAACSPITSNPTAITADVLAAVTAQLNLTLGVALQALTNDALSNVDGDITTVAGLLVDIITTVVDAIATVPSAVAGIQAALNALESVVNNLVSQLITKVASALTGVVVGVGASLVALLGCLVKSSGKAVPLANFNLNLILSACGIKS
ncbi:hypothetical protein PENSPDRAFT_679859 [Peniophora sp. CONT]|nr:hypothetical protein PENSPDRAFT_679859 [Peniophora sp. CONT]